MPKLKNSVLNAQSRQMIYAVFCYMKKTAEMGLAMIEVYKQTAQATNTSISTVRRIVIEGQDNDFTTPDKKRPRLQAVTTDIDFDQGAIRRCIQNYHAANKEIPTVHKLQQKLQSDINYQGSEGSLRRVIKALGFKWRKVGKNRKIMIENPHIRYQRMIYLETIKRYREEGHSIVYMDQLCFDSMTKSSPKATTDSTAKDQKKPSSKTQRVTVLHAATDSGFIPNALLIFQTEAKVGESHDNVNHENYQKWLLNHLIPNLPHNSVLVVNNASYNYKEYDPAPNSTAKRSEMIEWLREKGIEYDENMLKPVLYNLIRSNKDRFKQYNIDLFLYEHGHFVLRLPPCHPDLNPLKMAWADIKGYVGKKKVTWDFNSLTILIKERMELMEASGWGKAAGLKIREIEEEYRKNDHILDQMTEEFVVCVYESSSSDDDEDDDDSDFEKEMATTSANPIKIEFKPTTSEASRKIVKIPAKSEVPKNTTRILSCSEVPRNISRMPIKGEVTRKFSKNSATIDAPIRITRITSKSDAPIRITRVISTSKVPKKLARVPATSDVPIRITRMSSTNAPIRVTRMITTTREIRKLGKTPNTSQVSKTSATGHVSNKLVRLPTIRSMVAIKRKMLAKEITIEIEPKSTTSADSMSSERVPKRERISPAESASDVVSSYFNLWPI